MSLCAENHTVVIGIEENLPRTEWTDSFTHLLLHLFAAFMSQRMGLSSHPRGNSKPSALSTRGRCPVHLSRQFESVASRADRPYLLLCSRRSARDDGGRSLIMRELSYGMFEDNLIQEDYLPVSADR